MVRTIVCVLSLLVMSIGCRDEVASVDSAPVKSAPPPAAPRPAPPVCSPAPHRLCPVDEGAGDASFAAFRSALLVVVERRDRAGLLALVDPKMRTSFGEGGGIASFEKQWDLQNLRSALWGELQAILTSGGSFHGEGENRMFWAPYVYASWPEEVDAFSHVAAIRADVPVRGQADMNARPVATVSWEILELRTEAAAPDGEWLAVKTAGGVDGWVQKRDVRSPIGYRAGFSRRSGNWRLEALVAGD